MVVVVTAGWLAGAPLHDVCDPSSHLAYILVQSCRLLRGGSASLYTSPRRSASASAPSMYPFGATLSTTTRCTTSRDSRVVRARTARTAVSSTSLHCLASPHLSSSCCSACSMAGPAHEPCAHLVWDDVPVAPQPVMCQRDHHPAQPRNVRVEQRCPQPIAQHPSVKSASRSQCC